MNKLTVMMNCMNGEKYLSEALQNIINQSFENWQLYFFDNQSSDKSKDIFDSFRDSRFKYFCFNEFYDLGLARQKAWKEINSEYVAICDVDDISLEQRFDNQIKFLDSNLNYGVVGSNVFLIDNNSKKFEEIKYDESSHILKHKIQYQHVFNSATLMFRKKAVDEVGGYNPKYEIINDYDLLYRISKKFEISCLNKTLVCNRQHGNNLSYKKIVKGQLELLHFQKKIYKQIYSFRARINLLKNMFLTFLRIIYHSLKIKILKYEYN